MASTVITATVPTVNQMDRMWIRSSVAPSGMSGIKAMSVRNGRLSPNATPATTISFRMLLTKSIS